MAEKPVIICLTPVKNEAWIIERFLQCASLWADHIILADQQSTDATRKIAAAFNNVQIIENPSETFNEPERQALLIEQARKIPGKRLLLALDADECLSANFLNSEEWQNVLQLEKGTCVTFDWINLTPGMNKFWGKSKLPRGYMDDGAHFYTSRAIHSPKLPCTNSNPVFCCKEIKLLHYQYADWERMKSKHRWYQAWETLNYPEKNPLGLYRMYHHMYAVPKEKLLPLDKNWFKGYEDAGIDMYSVRKEDSYYWDEMVINYFNKYGVNRFSKITIWDKKWEGFDDPRNVWEKLVHWYLKKTQMLCSLLPIHIIDRVLKIVFR